MTPWSSVDEYFYDTGHQMLSDRGSNVVGETATEYPEDDYIWLDGRPIALVRSRFNAGTWERNEDGHDIWCPRDGEGGLCGTFMLVTDYLGKPVAMYDRGGTAGTATSEGFGYANRRQWRVGSPRYENGSALVTTIEPPMTPGFDGPLRILMSRTNYGEFSDVTLAGASQVALAGEHAHAWSDWEYASGNSWDVDWFDSGEEYGFDIEAYEIRAKQEWVWWAWTPLRYPGQYYDQETELHENWNRYYDPSTGHYLAPEPLLQSPAHVLGRARVGAALPTYAYARNNPLKYVDRDGFLDDDCTAGENECTAQAVAAHDAVCECKTGGGAASLVLAWDPVNCKMEEIVDDEGNKIIFMKCEKETTRIQGVRCDSPNGEKDSQQKCAGPRGQGEGSWFRSTPTDLAHFNQVGGFKCGP